MKRHLQLTADGSHTIQIDELNVTYHSKHGAIQESQHVFSKMLSWDEQAHLLPTNIDEFDWLTFEQQYRDYIDLAKLAVVGDWISSAINRPNGAKAGRAICASTVT